MLVILIEIGLACAAWSAGWKWKALLPVGGVLGTICVLGLVIGASGGDTRDYEWIVLVGDAVTIVALIAMVKLCPKSQSAGQQ